MGCTGKHMYFMLMERSPYTYTKGSPGSILYIEESRYLRLFETDHLPAHLPVSPMGTCVSCDVEVSCLHALKEAEAALLQALDTDEARLQSVLLRDELDAALAITLGAPVSVEVGEDWCQGVVRYVGSITPTGSSIMHKLPGVFFGVELQGKDEGKGQNDGSFGATQFFRCTKNCGIFAPFTRIRPPPAPPGDLPLPTSPRAPPSQLEPLQPGDRVHWFLEGNSVQQGVVRRLQRVEERTSVLITPDGEDWEKTVPLECVIKEELLSPGHDAEVPMDWAGAVEPARGQEVSFTAEGLPLSLNAVVEVMLSEGRTVYGTVRWIGTLPNTEGLRVGLELEEPVGVSDGTFKGQRLFQCPTRRGLFVKLQSCRPDSRFQATGGGGGAAPGSHTDWDCAVQGNVAPLWAEKAVQVLTGTMKGIQGHCNSCYMDSALFSLFSCSSVLDSLLFKATPQRDAPIQTTLLQEIVNPLRTVGFVPARSVMKLRKQLKEGGHCASFTTEEKDPEEFLSLIMHHILSLDPLLKLKSVGQKLQEGYCYQIFLDQNHSLALPTVRQLLEHSFHSAQLQLAEVPSCLILQMPRFGKKFKLFDKIVPSLELDITDLLCDGPRDCVLCGTLATVECSACFGDGSFGATGLKQFCQLCSKQVHSHPQRRTHTPSVLRLPEGFSQGRSLRPPRDLLQLFAVLCIETSHYVSFVRHGPGPEDWVFFDSMADRHGDEDGYNIPAVRPCPEVGRYLQMPLGQLALLSPRDMDGVAKRLFCDAYMYLYESPRMALYR
ncbi:ubiquitin carboxyl-terminal hydrolase CYLD [Amia ocellicauda]|uniref:ubiquitin carboxyl-terminal hydrolase CYLD n=1 Tax=Amia ocellicauda TaxID=2972642 RepID=UPI003463E7A6